MESIKIKLISLIAMICLVMGIMIVGIFSAQTQQIKLNGQVNFEIGDKSLYVKDVRLQENTDSSPYSLSEQGRFMPGYVNGEFNMNLGDFTNTYGSFALYFDIINTVDETSGETFAYTTESSTTQSGVTVTTAILDSNGSSISQIPQGTLKPSEITSSSPISATIKLTVSGTSGANVDLSQITITISEYVPQVYDYFDFEVNSDGTTVTLIDFNERLADTTDIVIPESVSQNESGQWIDGNTYKVTDILSATLTSDGVFYNSGITNIEFPSTLETIGNFAFSGCSGLTEVVLGNCTSLTSIGNRVFAGCSGLTSITLPSSLTSIGYSALSQCSRLTEVDLSNCASLTSIGNLAFEGCSGLTHIDLSKCTNLTSIGTYAFQDCSGLTSIILPSSLTNIGESAFYYCIGLNTLEYKGTLEQWLSIDFGLSWMGDPSHTFIVNGEELTNLVVPEGITTIPAYAFYGCTGLTNITLPSSLNIIGDGAFNRCSGLAGDLVIPEKVTSIGQGAFTSCNKLLKVDLSNCTSLISIGDGAFNSCTKLSEVDLSNCTSLISIGNTAFYSCYALTDVTIPERVTSIGERAFSYCTSLKSITFSNTTGWYATTSSSATTGTPMDMSNPEQNAEWLTAFSGEDYYGYYFKCNA